MNKLKKSNYSELRKVVHTIKIQGYKWIGNGHVTFDGKPIDLTATAPNELAIAYDTLDQLMRTTSTAEE